MEVNREPQKIRHDWYQTDTHVFVNILCKNVKEADLNVKYEADSVFVSFSHENEVKQDLSFKLLREVIPLECSHKITSSKIELKLKKNEAIRWEKLENDGTVDLRLKQAMAKTSYPSSSLKTKDWDKVVEDITKNDEENLEGEGALNVLFQKIYSEGNDEVRKAMNKSFIESGGTVLSTNWGDVKRERVDVKPPDGMEFKKWD